MSIGHMADHMRERHGLEVGWANEALRDPDALRIDPDPSSKSGRSVRTIGYFPTAGILLTVITVTEGEATYGVNGWRSNTRDIKRYRGVVVSTKIQRLVAEEAASSEANPDAPLPTVSTVSRPNRARSTVYSIRLNPDEVAEVQALADAAGLPPSTLVRSWITERIRAEHGELSDAESELRAAQRHLAHLQRHLSQHAS